MRFASPDFQLLFESLPGAYVVVAPEENYPVIAASDAFLHELKTVRQKIVGRSVLDVLSAKASDLRPSLERAVREKSADSSNTPVLGPDQEVLYIIHRLEHTNGELQRLIREMSVRKRELEISNRLKDEFVQTVSHELRTPLTSICGWAAMLRSPELDPANRARAIDAIERNSKIQLSLVDDLLDMSRLITGRLNLNIQQVDLAAIIEEVVESLRIAAEAKHLSIALELERTAGPVFGDANRLRQIVLNLLSNAIKFTDDRGEVFVMLRRINSHVELVVNDNGQGIRPEFLPHVFERFRADHSPERENGGLGIGLSIVKSLVELHGGAVTAASEGAGKGTTFTVSLPLLAIRVNPSQAAHRLNETPVGDQDLEGLRLVLVEDDPDTLALLAVILEGSGAEVRSCMNADEAIETVGRWQPHLLLSDIGLPGKDGYTLIQELLRSDPSLARKMVAVALTAYASAADRQRALSCGFQAHLAKPIDPKELVGVVARLTERVRQQRP